MCIHCILRTEANLQKDAFQACISYCLSCIIVTFQDIIAFLEKKLCRANCPRHSLSNVSKTCSTLGKLCRANCPRHSLSNVSKTCCTLGKPCRANCPRHNLSKVFHTMRKFPWHDMTDATMRKFSLVRLVKCLSYHAKSPLV